MGFKKTMLLGLVVASMGLSAFAATPEYHDLIIQNDTKQPSTSVINGGACSTIIGASGTTEPGRTNPVKGNLVAFVCGKHITDCKADIYMARNCKGPIVANAEIDLEHGVKYIRPVGDKGYVFSWEGFMVKMSGGPAK